MKPITRRDCLQGMAAVAAASTSQAATTNPARKPVAGEPGIQLAGILVPGQTGRYRLLKQVGVDHAIASVNGVLGKIPKSQYRDALAKVQSEFRAAGLTIAGVESHPVNAEKIKLGIDGRDEELENYIAAIQALAELGIPMICYNWMAGIGWYRTKTNLPERGGALSSEFDYRDAEKQGLTKWGEVPEEKLWATMEYFQKAVMPAAQKAGVKMALHPDDPPISPLRGIGRIVTSAANYRRVMNIVPCPVNGVTFCQANFMAMGEDIEAVAKEFLREKKIFFVHFRDIEGTREHFRETFHDNGPHDMARMLAVYHEHGFHGPMRPDHAPTLEGESNDNPGYAMMGKILAFGYMKGLMEAQKIPYA
jgi:mannonate dehydratase